MPRENAHRVVEGARNLAPALGERMMGARLLDSGVFVRELLPQDLKLEIDRMTQEEAVTCADYLGRVVGVAHGRQMDAGTRREWRRALSKGRLSTIDTPSWLWSSVVDLVAAHEAAYLEHCRRYVASGQRSEG